MGPTQRRSESERRVVGLTPILLPTELKSVGETVVSGLKSETGTTATLESSYVAVSLGSGDVVAAGFTLTPKDGSPFEVAAVVDAGSSSSTRPRRRGWSPIRTTPAWLGPASTEVRASKGFRRPSVRPCPNP